MAFFDQYEIRARHIPSVLCFSPAIVLLSLIFSESSAAIVTPIAALVAIGGSMFLIRLVRDSAKSKELALFASWGGMPSVARFRHRDERLRESEKIRLHKKMESLVSGTRAPTAAEENADPATADEVYTRWSDHLRKNTRDKEKFAILFHENVSYGYSRNLWAMKSIGIATALCCILTVFLMLLDVFPKMLTPQLAAISMLVSVSMIIVWIFVTPNWVRRAADGYAHALIECADNL